MTSDDQPRALPNEVAGSSSERQVYWPGHWLVPSTNILRAQLLPEMEDFERYRRVALQLEQLPYCIGATCYALLQLVTTQHATVTKDFDQSLREATPTVHILRDYERDRMGFLIDSTLEAARRSQNALVLYINRARKVNLPNSMARCFGALQKKPTILSDDIKLPLIEYWRSHGERLRDYRVLSQHHALVSSDARVFRSADGGPAIYLVLPNNPEEKNLSSLRYERPFVHAVPYLHREFFELVKICNIVCEQLLDRSRPAKASYGPVLKSSIVIGQPLEGNRLITVDDVAKNLRRHLPRLRPPVPL